MIAARSALRRRPGAAGASSSSRCAATPARRRSLLVLCAIYGVACAGDPAAGRRRRRQRLVERCRQLMRQGDRRRRPRSTRCWPSPALPPARCCWRVLRHLPLSLPFWHAPALVHWGGQGVGAERCSSARWRCWRNKGAFFASSAWPGSASDRWLFGLVAGAAARPARRAAAGRRWSAMPAGLVFSARVLRLAAVHLQRQLRRCAADRRSRQPRDRGSTRRAAARTAAGLRAATQSTGVSLATDSASHLTAVAAES